MRPRSVRNHGPEASVETYMQKYARASVLQSRPSSSKSNKAELIRPVIARQGYSRPGPYNKAFQATSSALQKAQSRDLAFQALMEIENIIGDSIDNCDALSGLIAALTAPTMHMGSRVERKTIAQSLCAVAARLGKRAGFTWPRVLQYLTRQMTNSEVFEVDRPYMVELVTVYGAYARYVLEPADMDLLISCIEDTIEKGSPLTKTVGVIALSKVVEEMHACGTFDPMDNGVKLAEYLCGIITKSKKDSNDQLTLEAMLLLQNIVQMDPEIMCVPPLARRVVLIIVDGCTHRSWRVKEAALQVLGTTDIPNKLPATLVKDIVQAAELCKYDRINAVRISARSLLSVLDTQGQGAPTTSKKRPQSSMATHTWNIKSRPESASLEHRYLDRPSNRNTLISWVPNVRRRPQSQLQFQAKRSNAVREPIHTRAYTFVPTDNNVEALPFRQSRILDCSSSSTSSMTDYQLGSSGTNSLCYKSRDLLQMIEEGSRLSDTAFVSPRVQTVVFCKTPVCNDGSPSSSPSPAIY